MFLSKEDKRQLIAALARSLLGVPYKSGARPSDPPLCTNCSMLSKYLFGFIGIELKGWAIRQAEEGREVSPKIDQLETGDLIFIRGKRGFYNEKFPKGIGHVGIYVGKGKVISARKKEGKVIEESVEEYFSPLEFTLVKRVI